MIDAELSQIRKIVRDFKQWEPWSPWLSAEPDCALSYAEDGKSYSWDGTIIGSGTLELLREEDAALWCRITFHKPWKSQSEVDFQFESTGAGTKVCWRMNGSLPFFMFFMKKMMSAWIGSDYRRGLAKLKDYVETGTVPSQNEFPGLGEGVVTAYIGLRQKVELEDMKSTMSEQYNRLHEWFTENKLEAAGAPMAIYHKMSMVDSLVDYTAAIPVAKIPDGVTNQFVCGELDAPRTFKVVHKGAYRHLGSAWSAAMMHQRSKRFRKNKNCDPFEVYQTDPHVTPAEDLITEIHLPAR